MRHEKHYYVYILASLSGTLYIGITNNLEGACSSIRKDWSRDLRHNTVSIG